MMSTKTVLHTVCGALVILQLFAGAARAAEQTSESPGPENPTMLEQIVVTATRTEMDPDSAPGSISVVTKEDMEKRNIFTVDEALNTIPGVVTTRGKGLMDQMSAITLRGLPSQSRTLVMIDGITLNSPYSGAVFSTGISPDSLERIEVVKGASSSLYGGYAMGGVINMITKMPKKRECLLQSGYGSGLAGDGMENTRRVAVSYGDSFKDKLRVYIHNDYWATDGYRADLNAQGTQPGAGIFGYSMTTDATGAKIKYIIGDKGLNGAWQDNLTLKSEYSFSPETRLRFTFMKSAGGYEYQDPRTYLRNTAGNEVWAYGSVKEGSFLGSYGFTDQYLYHLAFETELSPVQIKCNLGLTDQVSNWGVTPDAATATRFGGAGKFSNTPASAWNADLQATFPVFSRNLVTLGGSFRTGSSHTREYALGDWQDERTRGAITYESRGTDRTFAIFAQDEIYLHEKLTLYLGFRQDWWETYDGYADSVGTAGYPKAFDSRNAAAFSPKGAIVCKPFEQTTVKISGGRAFRAPTNYDLYRTWTSASGITYNSNPDLKPETTISWDAGISQGLWQGANITVTYYENYLSDLIYSSTTGKTNNKLNAGKGESKGVEMEAEQRFGQRVRVFGTYTYADSRITENSSVPASVGKHMTNVPEHMFNVGTDIEYGPFGATFIGRYVGKRYASDTNKDTARNVPGAYDPFFTADIKMRYNLTSWATASFSINNLLDEQYYSYSRAPGRSCYGELSFTF
jgi:iron complex outermembrane receptor protein